MRGYRFLREISLCRWSTHQETFEDSSLDSLCSSEWYIDSLEYTLSSLYVDYWSVYPFRDHFNDVEDYFGGS